MELAATSGTDLLMLGGSLPMEGVWTLKDLTEEQKRLLNEAEESLGGGILLAYDRDQISPSDLTPDQLECLQGLEEKLGAVVVAVKRP